MKTFVKYFAVTLSVLYLIGAFVALDCLWFTEHYFFRVMILVLSFIGAAVWMAYKTNSKQWG